MIRRHVRVLDEAVRDSAAQRRQALGVISLLAILSAGLLLLSSREQFDRDQLRSQLNSPAARTVTFSISGGAAAIDDAAVGRIEELGDVEFAVGFGPATDVVNANLPFGDPVAYRSVVGDLSSIFPEVDRGFSKQRALAVQPAAESLGFIDGAGSIENAAHVQRSVIGTLAPASDFAWLDQTVLGRPDSDTGLQTLVMRLTTAGAVDANAAIAIELLGVENPGSIRLEFAQALIEANAGVARLADQQRQAVKIGTLAAVTALNAVVLTTLVGARRRDFGRRRALGASRTDVLTMVVTGFGILSVIGSSGGLLLGVLGALAVNWPIPDPGILVAVLTATISSGILSTIPPALSASRSSPLRQLRQP